MASAQSVAPEEAKDGADEAKEDLSFKPQPGQWFKFDDETVTAVDAQEAIEDTWGEDVRVLRGT